MKRAPARTAVPTCTPAVLSPEWRFQDLRRAHITNLPTPHRRTFYRLCAALCAAGTIEVAHVAVSEKPVSGIAAVGGALATFGYIVAAREANAQLRSPPTASFDEPTEGEQAGADALEGASKIALSGGEGLYDTAAGFAGNLAAGLWRRRKPRQVARWQAATSVDLLTAERRLVSCQAVLVPHGLRRLLIWLSIGLALPWLVKLGVLTVTDQRLLFHRRSRFRRRRGPYHVHVSAPLAELELLEWFAGSFTEPRSQVLIVRCPNGRIARFNIHKVWEEEGQFIFDVVASRSQRLPHFLAARWTLSPVHGRAAPPSPPATARRPTAMRPPTGRASGSR